MKQELKRPEIIRIHFEKLECRGSGKYIGEEYWHQGKPFTGFVVFDYHDNGFVEFEQEHVDGQTMGWEVEYYPNGKIKLETLMYGATSVVFREFDEQGNLTSDEGWVYPKEFYNSVARYTGMPTIDEYGYTDE